MVAAVRSMRVFAVAAVALMACLAALAATMPVSASAAPAGRAAPHSWYEFAPYVDLTGYPVPSLRAIRQGAGARDLTLAFVTAEANTRCDPTWGGYATYPASGPHPYQLTQIRAFRRTGGAVVISFGGEAGAELATVCSSASALEAAYARVVSAYGATRLDFDIEGADVANAVAARRRAAALAELQRAAARRGHTLHISLTLPTLPSGLTADSDQIVRDTVDGGVRVSLVNGMAMDFGDSAAPDPARRMGTDVIDVARHLRTQLGAIFPRLSARSLASLIGITPMIGVNDTTDEVFTLADARALAGYARRSHLGMLSLWEAARDRRCSAPETTAQDDCSGVTESAWAFSRILRR